MPVTQQRRVGNEPPDLGRVPPHPRLVLRIGVTGHRMNRIGEEAAGRVATAIASLFAGLEDELAALHDANGGVYAEKPMLRVVSPVAEGADRLVAEAALARGHELQIALPFPRDEYARDFRDPTSVIAFRTLLERAWAVFELPGQRDDATERDNAYEAVGLFTLRQSDLLLAVWDGGGSRGRGGTADIVAAAVRSGIPVVWIDPEGEREPRLLWAGREAATPDETDLRSVPPEAFAARRRDVIRALLAPPPSATDSKDRLGRFLGESPPRWSLPFGYPLLQALTAIRPPRWSDVRQPFDGAAARAGWDAYWRRLPEDADFACERLASVLLRRFYWADSLATHYAQAYRSGYVTNFILSAGAVAMALMGLLAPQGKFIWVLVELTLIGLILVNTLVGTFRRWHERWLDYRHLAEQLRHLRFLALTGSRARTANADWTGDASWVAWYAAATQRELGLPGAIVDERYVEAVRAILSDVELAEQEAYHHGNARRLEAMHGRLHIAGLLAFGGTALVCLGFLAIDLVDHDAAASWAARAAFLTALLPAVGAALYGIRTQGDFEGVADRSAAMASRLEKIRDRLQQRPLNFRAVSQLAEHSSETMLAEVADWRLVFRTRPLDLAG